MGFGNVVRQGGGGSGFPVKNGLARLRGAINRGTVLTGRGRGQAAQRVWRSCAECRGSGRFPDRLGNVLSEVSPHKSPEDPKSSGSSLLLQLEIVILWSRKDRIDFSKDGPQATGSDAEPAAVQGQQSTANSFKAEEDRARRGIFRRQPVSLRLLASFVARKTSLLDSSRASVRHELSRRRREGGRNEVRGGREAAHQAPRFTKRLR